MNFGNAFKDTDTYKVIFIIDKFYPYIHFYYIIIKFVLDRRLKSIN
jgi:hypothetical protein